MIVIMMRDRKVKVVVTFLGSIKVKFIVVNSFCCWEKTGEFHMYIFLTNNKKYCESSRK